MRIYTVCVKSTLDNFLPFPIFGSIFRCRSHREKKRESIADRENLNNREGQPERILVDKCYFTLTFKRRSIYIYILFVTSNRIFRRMWIETETTKFLFILYMNVEYGEWWSSYLLPFCPWPSNACLLLSYERKI